MADKSGKQTVRLLEYLAALANFVFYEYMKSN